MKRRVVLASSLFFVSLATAASLAVALYQSHRSAAAQADMRVEFGARLLGELYATRRAQVALESRQIAGDSVLQDAVKTGNATLVNEWLTRRAPAEGQAFAAVLSAQGKVLASVGSEEAITGYAAVRAEARPLIPELELWQAGGEPYLVAVSPVGRRGAVAYHGVNLSAGLVGRVSSLSDAAVALRVFSATGAGSAGAGAPRVVTLELDRIGDQRLVGEITLQPGAAMAGFRRTLWSAIAMAVLCFVLSFTGLAILLRRMDRRAAGGSIRALTDALKRAKDGDYGGKVSVRDGDPLGPAAAACNAMLVQIAERESRISQHGQYDALTGLTNRSLVNERIRETLTRAERTNSIVAAIAIDITRFNEINGSLGQEAGDEVLKEVARRLASNTRVSDTVARVGGDEFFVLLEDTDVKLANHMTEFLVTAIEAPIAVAEQEVRLSVRAGLALYPNHCETMEALRRMANIALLTAKETKERVVVYEAGQDEKQLRELAIVHDLPNAIRNGELYLQYQPKIEIETQRVEFVEALVRWRHPQLGFIPPDEFVSLVEKSGTVANLTEWVFKAAIRQRVEWASEGYDLGIAVNISANDLSDESLPARVQALLHHHVVDASKISVEVTESAVISDPERSVRVLNEFRRIGFRVALDDFGTGQTSLALLKELPLTELKIDKSFVQNLRANSGDAIIVKSIIDLGHNMGLIVTAEGVESNYCWNLLNSYGCDMVQGYLVSAPLTADELAAWHLRLQDRHVNELDFSCVHSLGG